MSAQGSAANGMTEPELWCVDLEAGAGALHALESRTPRLSDWDRQQASAMADAGAADQWRATHIALRLLLERAVGARWRNVPLVRGPGVRPHIEGAPVAFSLSHVADLALIALGPVGDIGVDLERSRPVRMRPPRRGLIETAGVALNPSSALSVDADARFLQAWVRLEAFAKAECGGIGRLLTRLGIVGGRELVEADLKHAVETARAQAAAGAVHDIDLGEGLFAALALSPGLPVPRVRRLPASLDGLQELVS